ncbi:hypothetical protein HMPREF9136_0651 [Prevotella dentalis DSM 3688]|uniref:Uncharacterized protein n=1 Tax=Prevotella dentalis (strain ATCC 49559 / DSM 3688 / JCM 13448 / NCTC 12043 / ES 2772) TaxID=908937 RepID=F9D1C3_PREDD|nr:hypothetical protein HMPREF9136_0651 [Prevotella dentalis DSM 3688]
MDRSILLFTHCRMLWGCVRPELNSLELILFMISVQRYEYSRTFSWLREIKMKLRRRMGERKAGKVPFRPVRHETKRRFRR